VYKEFLKRLFIWSGNILLVVFVVSCGAPAVKETPKQPPVAKTETKTPEVKAVEKEIDKMTVMMHFNFDRSTLTPADIKELDKAVAFVKKYQSNKIRINGYSDIVGDENYNIKLSEKRANVTKDYLIKNAGIKPENITAKGNGTTDPIGDRTTEAGRAMNRRAVISIISQ